MDSGSENESLLDELNQEHDKLTQESDKAECLRTSSDSDDDHGIHDDDRLSWAQLLHQHAPPPGSTPLQTRSALRKTRLRILSGCTGLCSEAAAMKAAAGFWVALSRREHHQQMVYLIFPITSLSVGWAQFYLGKPKLNRFLK